MASRLSGCAKRRNSSTSDIAGALKLSRQLSQLVGELEFSFRAHPPEARGLKLSHHRVDFIAMTASATRRIEVVRDARGLSIAGFPELSHQPRHLRQRDAEIRWIVSEIPGV